MAYLNEEKLQTEIKRCTSNTYKTVIIFYHFVCEKLDL